MFDKIMYWIDRIWAFELVKFIVYLLVALIVAGVAKFIAVRLLKLVRLDRVLDKWGVRDERTGGTTTLVGNLVYVVVLLLFLPAALGTLGLETVSGPLSLLADAFVGYIPNVVAAGILVYVGVFIAGIVGQIVYSLLRKTKLDTLINGQKEEKHGAILSDIISKIVSAVIILITVVQALSVLNVDAISKPAISIVNAVFSAVPSIILAAVVIACGLLVAKIACGLLENLLNAVNLGGFVGKFIPQLKESAVKIVVGTVRALIILFVIAQGVEALGLGIFTIVVTAIVAYLPMVIKSAVIALAAFVGASVIENVLGKAQGLGGLVKILKAAVYTLAAFMILSQLDIASTIVNTAFTAIIVSAAVASALAFGLGGREFAKHTLDKLCKKLDGENKQ